MTNLKMLAVAVALVGSVSAAQAAPYAFAFTGVNVSGNGTIYTVDSSADSAISSITGTIFDSEVGTGPFTITTLSTYAGADNIYHTTAPFADFGGISFNTSTGGAFNIGGGGSLPGGLVLNSAVLNPSGVVGVRGSTDITAVSAPAVAAAVPEAATWAMMMVGLGIVGGSLRRRNVTTRIVFA